MRSMIPIFAGVVMTAGLAFMVVSQAQAAPMSPAPAIGSTAPSATPAHCRRYTHCHRRCWWGRYGRQCRRICHRC